ncbi:MAG: ribonuclease HI [Deltaproteobacteria bacterium]|nr:ribonuclease HI [Deltaproteobacteria bacterium]MBN2671296.1 ribonuclease HI [Deltaproteobacteria bacterium]
MSYKRMLFKGKSVYVEVDDHGAVLEQGGRAVMKYRLDDERTYNPAVANLSEEGGAAGDLFSDMAPKTTTTPVTPKRAAQKTQSSASPGSSIGDAIVAYTDGGCIGNPGPAGLGYVIRFPDNRVIQKGEPLGQGTNNIAELTAIWRVLQIVTDKTAPLRIHTDSSYAIGVLTQGWKAKANQQLIADIRHSLNSFRNVKLIKVKGHAGNPDNERVDTLANTAARTQKALE